MRRGRHSVEHERRCRGSLSDVGRTQHRNLGLRDWKSESFESWKFFSLRVDSAKHDDCHAYNQKSLLMHTSVQKLATAVQQGAR
jgi:hypothetical protein